MRMILHIFLKDMKGLLTNLFVLIIAGGLCILPCLYAWFNIYSNWDPYANTGSVKVAVASLDKGYEKSDGTTVNMGNDVIDQLHENKNLGWVFPDTADDAVEGVNSGEYYAAIVIGDDFSEKLYDFVDNGMEHPKVTYYENAKKNAIAVKITDSGKTSLEGSINQEFIDVVVTMVMDNISSIMGENGDAFDTLIADLKELQTNLHAYNDALEAFQSSNTTLADTIEEVKSILPEVEIALNEGVSSVSDTAKSMKKKTELTLDKLDSIFTSMDTSTKAAQGSLKKGLSLLDTNPEKSVTHFLKAQTALKSLVDQNAALIKAVNQLTGIDTNLDKAISDMKTTLDGLGLLENTAFDILKEATNMFKDAEDNSLHLLKIVKPIIENTLKQIPNINKTIAGDLKKNIKTLQKSASKYIDSMTESLDSIDFDLSGLGGVLTGINTTMLGMNGTLGNLHEVLQATGDQLDELIEELNTASDDEKYEKIKDLFTADSSAYGEFLSAPVEVTTEHVFAIKNYGSAVTPFYTTLAMWVGALLLTALIKVNVKKDAITSKAKLYQLYFGRYLLFFVLGQVQAVLTVAGDLYILKVQCLEPGLFLFTACFTSFVFTLFIYTITLAWGDVGKALAVVMVVIQIAGSSGTYPIELLPDFYQKIYLFFPFPYAINAMRETICGMYEDTFMYNIGMLSLYLVVALAIGLLIRKPFIKLNHFMEERMEDTRMM